MKDKDLTGSVQLFGGEIEAFEPRKMDGKIADVGKEVFRKRLSELTHFGGLVISRFRSKNIPHSFNINCQK